MNGDTLVSGMHSFCAMNDCQLSHSEKETETNRDKQRLCEWDGTQVNSHSHTLRLHLNWFLYTSASDIFCKCLW